MKALKPILERLVELMNIGDFRVELNEDESRLSLFLNNDPLIKKNLPDLVNHFNHLGQLIAKRQGINFHCIDVNNYRLERERLITALAKAAARKALMTKDEISLPAMNSYERRLVHMELAMRPDVKTESVGEGRSRYVVIRPIADE